MRLLLLLSSLLLLALLPESATAQTPQIERAEILDYGIYTARTMSRVPAPREPTGLLGVARSIRHIETTQTIPAKRGLRFGLRYRLTGVPAGKVVPLDVDVIFPFPGLRKPSAQQASGQSHYVSRRRIGQISYIDYHFEHDWEEVPGPWTMQISYQGRKLVEQQFFVVKR